MTQDPEVDVATYLAAAGLSLTLGTNLFRGKVLAVGNGVPAEAVFVELAEAERPEPYLGAANMWPAAVDVTVRGAPGDRTGPRTRALNCLLALHRATLEGYVSVVSADSYPEHVERDGANCHEWVFTVLLEWQA